MLISSATYRPTAFTPTDHSGQIRGTGAGRVAENTVLVDKSAGTAGATDNKDSVASVERSQSASSPVYSDPRVEAQRKAREAAEHKQELLDSARIQELSARDREVRAHEQAHVAVGGRYAGAAVYQYERGPNGVSYAVGGEVSISVGPASTPEETLLKAQTIRRAALAPAEPSPQDRQVAAGASRLEAQARQELAERRESDARIKQAESSDPVEASHGKDASTDSAAARDQPQSAENSHDQNLAMSPYPTSGRNRDDMIKPHFLTGYQQPTTIGGVIDSRA